MYFLLKRLIFLFVFYDFDNGRMMSTLKSIINKNIYSIYIAFSSIYIVLWEQCKDCGDKKCILSTVSRFG